MANRVTNRSTPKSPEDANKQITGDMKVNLEYGTDYALVQNSYLDRDHDPRYGMPVSAFDPDSRTRIDPALHHGPLSGILQDYLNVYAGAAYGAK